MELETESDTYTPSIDNMGNYIDFIPPFTNRRGLRCPCGSRKDKTYETSSMFSTHIKSKAHQKWLTNLNLNKANYYIENEQLKLTLHNQRLIIAKMDKEIQNKIMTIDYLTQQLCIKNATQSNINLVDNLLHFD